jgi:hypothetical protein
MPTTCDRCRASTTVTTMSKFNTDTICMSCEEDERLAPGYREACRVESDAVRSGDYNFPRNPPVLRGHQFPRRSPKSQRCPIKAISASTRRQGQRAADPALFKSRFANPGPRGL